MRADDAVVIGAGPNGLVATNLPADAGWSSPGGAVHGAPGANAARAALARWRPLLGSGYRAAIGIAHDRVYRS